MAQEEIELPNADQNEIELTETKEKLIQNVIELKNITPPEFFLNDEALIKQIYKQNGNIFTFYCCSSLFDKFTNQLLKLIIYKDSEQLVKNMTQIPNTNIFYIHICLYDQKVINYFYLLQNYLQSEKFTRNVNDSNQSIFDTPQQFCNYSDDSMLLLKSYTLLYAQNCDIVSNQFFQRLDTFIHSLEDKSYDNLTILPQNNEDFRNLPYLNQIIYVGSLQRQQQLKENKIYFKQNLNIEEICKQKQKFKDLPKEMKLMFGIGFQNMIQKNQLLKSLKLPKIMRQFIHHSTWNFQIDIQPQNDIIEQINFKSINQQLKDRLYSQITQLNEITLVEILYYIQIIQPSVRYQIDSFKRYYLRKQTKNKFVKIIIEYISNQAFSIQKQFILNFEFRQAFYNEDFIKLGIDIILNNANQQIDVIQEEEVKDILIDILKNFKVLPISVFKNEFARLLIVLNLKNFSCQIIVNELQSLIKYGGQELYQIILSINFSLKNSLLEQTLNQSIIDILVAAKLKQEEYYHQFQKIFYSSFFKLSNSQKDLLVKVFNMITSFLPVNQDLFNLINDQNLLDCLIILKKQDAITNCTLPNQIIEYFNTLISNLSQNKINFSDLSRLLQQNIQDLLKFLEIFNIQSKVQSLIECLEQKMFLTYAIGLKQFALLIKDLEISKYQNAYANLKVQLESDDDSLLEQLIVEKEFLKSYNCLEFLGKFYHYNFVNNYIKSSLMRVNQQNSPKSDIELDQKIIQLISEIKNHLEKINTYQIINDDLTLFEVFKFWDYTFQVGNQEQNEDEIFQFIKQLQIYFDQKQQPCIKNFIQDIVNTSKFQQNKFIIKKIISITQIIELQQNKKNKLENLQKTIIYLENMVKNLQLNFSQFLQGIAHSRMNINYILYFVPKECRQDIQDFLSIVESTKKLIEYLIQLEKEKIQLEDLVDIIDDTSMETDTLVQEMMNVKNALQLIRQGEDDKENLIQCFVSRFQKYKLNLKKHQKLESIIKKCIDNLDFIRLKIQSQSDKSRQILQTIKNLEKQITIDIKKRLENQNESQLLLSTSSEIYQNFKDNVFNFDDFNLLCNRYKLIKSNKNNNQQQQQEEQLQVENSKETIYNNLIQILQLSEQIRLTLDNITNLGYIKLKDTNYIQKNSLKLIIPQLVNDLKQYKEINETLIHNLTLARQQYLSLNFYHPHSFELIHKLKNCIHNQSESNFYLSQLSQLTLFINENQQPNLDKFKIIIQKQQIENYVYEVEVYGQALDSLINLPMVQYVKNKPQQLEKITEGFQIECRRIQSHNLLLKTIVSIFLAHNQKPTSWQIFFCYPKTSILDLEQFAYLAKNSIQNQTYKKQNPLFLICQFENLPMIVQRQFVDKLAEMYERKEKINLLITYVGNFIEENSMHILQQFRYAFQVNISISEEELNISKITTNSKKSNLSKNCFKEDFQELKIKNLIQFTQIESLDKIYLHHSQYSGLGKTFQIKKRCRENNQTLIEIPIYGETTVQQLISLIQKKLEVIKNNQVSQYRLHLNLYDLKSNDIHSILFQLLVLRKLSYSRTFFAQIPPQMEIEIEIQNTFMDVFEKKVQYLKEIIHPNNIFKYDLKTIHLQNPVAKSIDGADLEIFEVIDNPNIKYEELQLSLQYLKNFSKISSFQIKNFEKEEELTIYLQQNQVDQKEAIQLIKDHFIYQLQDNFSFYHIICILKFFCKQVVLFHKNIYLQPKCIYFQGIDNSFRNKVFEGIVNTSVPYSCQIMSNNFLNKEQEMNRENLPYFDALDQRNKNIKSWDDNLGQANDFFLTISQSGTILPIFQKIQSVPTYLLNYFSSLNNKIQDWDDLQNIRDNILINLCTSAKNIKKVEQELKQKYNDIALTKAIARKICFLYIKINSDIPTLIMGETGVGKTILVKYLSSLVSSIIFTLDVHAGLTQDEIIKWVNVLIGLSFLKIAEYQKIIEQLNKDLQKDPENEDLNYQKNQVTQFYEFKMNQQNEGNRDFNDQKIILFFDEINTNQNIDGILKELLVEKRIQGEPLPDNFVPIAAANPYKFKTEIDQQENTDSLKISSCSNQQTSKLVYHVYPLAESMNTFIWQFGQLLPEDETKIITKMVQNASVQNKQIANFQQTLIQTITRCQEFSRKNQSIRSVSLRDVSRFLKIFQYFIIDPAWKKDLPDSLLLTVFFSYYCRFNNIKLREELCKYLESEKTVNCAENTKPLQEKLKKIVNQQMELIQGILEQGDLYKSIAYTSTLKENLFMVLISVLNNIPIIMVGPPGSSKTLCTRLLYNSMKGSKSNIEFFKKLPNLIYKTYQCSTLSTSESIEKAFKSAKQLDNTIRKSNNETSDGAKNIVALILDEIGLAEASKSNPLKALHRLLEYQQNVPMIGLSNWSLDASKMNRVVFCNRPKLSQEELIEAAIALQKRINPESKNCQNILINLAKDSFNYFQQDISKTFFHGTRDFYSCATFICNKLKDNDEQIQNSVQKIILTGILRNFGGQRNINDTLAYFKQCLGQTAQQLYDSNINLFNPTELIQMNINDNNCRNLMIITKKPGYALQYIEMFCQKRLYKVFQGSDLYDDFTEYNTLKMLNEIITCMEEGYLVIMYSLESLYQSFYDLLNQNYVELGAKHFCRIAIGSDSIRSQVHPNFKAIIIAQSDDVYGQRQHYDPPLLNRFEKQYLEMKFLLKQNEVQIKMELSKFIQNNSEIKYDERLQLQQNFGVQDMFPIIQNDNKDEFLYSLILKNNDEKEDLKRIQKSSYELVDLANFSGVVRAHFLKKLDPQFYLYYINSLNHFSFRDILEKLSKQKNDELVLEYGEFNYYEGLRENLIIYTTEYKYQYDSKYSIKQKNFMELEVKGLLNIENLKFQVKQFFYSDFVNLIIISSVSDSITKLLYIKRILQEERQLYELEQQLEQREKRPKNLILVIQLINQQTKFVGFSFDKLWQQIYIEDTSTPQNSQDDLQNYLQPIAVLLKNVDNGIYHQILQESFPQIIVKFTFEQSNLTKEDVKKRLDIYHQILQIKSDQDLNFFIINKIIESIENKCKVVSDIYGRCEWYHLVSLMDKENKSNNKFISSLKQFLFSESLIILTKMIYVAERNYIISSQMSDELTLQLQDINQIFQLWIQNYDELSEEDKFCDQIQIIQYPFLSRIKQHIDSFKYISLEKINEIFQIEERKQIRINGGYPEEEQNIDDQNNINSNNNEIINKQKKAKQNIKEIIKILTNQTKCVNPILMEISKIKPLLYFENLHYEVEQYSWVKDNTVKRITKKIIDVLEEGQAVESFHFILWVNEQIFTKLNTIWTKCEEEENSQINFETIYQKFKQRLQKILEDYLKEIQVYNKNQNLEMNKDINYQREDLNILEQIWSEMLTFSSDLLELFITSNGQDNKLINLNKYLGVIYDCSLAYELFPQKMIQQMSKCNFILKISKCFTQDKDFLSLKKQLYEQNNEFEFINIKNYKTIKQNFINLCDKQKENELVLRLIWQLLKCDCFKDEFQNFDNEILKDIILSLSDILGSIKDKNISKSQEDSHKFIFAKRILQIIVQKMYESFDENEEEEQIENLLEPQDNESFNKMQKIFEELKIEKLNPICSIITDIIKEYNFYTPNTFLNFIGQKSNEGVEVSIQEAKVEKIGKFLQRISENSQNKTLINIIEFRIIQELCQTICKFIYEAYQYDKREESKDQKAKLVIEQNYNQDRVRKNRLIEILNKALLDIIKEIDQLNPILPIILVKMFKKIFDIKNVNVLSRYLQAFQNQIFLESNQNDNILETGQLGQQFRNDLKHKKLTNLENEIKSQLDNLPLLQFNLTMLISEVIKNQNKQEFDLMIEIFNQLSVKIIDTNLINEIQILYLDLLQNDPNIPLELQQLFITNLVMTTFLNEDSFISKIYNGNIEIEATFIPFMVDSDEILAIYDELKNTTAIRRYQCKNCIKQQIKPYIYSILPCCMPVNNLGQCPFCKVQPRLEDHYSPDIEPPPTVQGEQEPIFVKRLTDYPDYSDYYNKPNFPYTNDVQEIDKFLKNRGKVDTGFQKSFSLIKIKQIRNLIQKEQILFGRIFMLSIICFYCHLIKKQKGMGYSDKKLGLCSPNDIFKLIYSNKNGNQIEQIQSWNLLVQATQATAQNILIYFINKVVKNYLSRQSNKNFTDKLNFSEDQNRIQFESEFVDKILEANELINIKAFTEQLLQKIQNQNNTNNIIFNCKLDLLPNKIQYLKQYQHQLRLNPVIEQDNFQKYITIDSEGIQSNFFKKLMDQREQIHMYSQIQPIQKFIKLFNLKMFDKITRKQSTEIKLQQFVKENNLKKEFEQFKQSWNYMKQQIHDGNINITVDCARIELDEVESEQQKIDIFCYSQDQDSRGYPLYLLINYFQDKHNGFLQQLEQDFSQLFSQFQSKKFIIMGKKNFLPPSIFSDDQENKFAKKFFNDYIEKFSGHNPYLEHEGQEIYDLNELTCDFLEDYYQNVTRMEQTTKQDLERVQLVNFRFKDEFKAINILKEIEDKVEQSMYPEIQNDPANPLLYINLQNNETCKRLINILKTIMQILTKINCTKTPQDQILLLDILEYFEIQASEINFTKEKIKLCHLISIYELVERISFENMFEDINPLFKIELKQSQKDVLKQFCDEQPSLQLDIFQQAIGRMIVRILCEQNIQMSQKQELFQLFKCEEFKEFWGMENKNYYEQQITNSDWNQKYSIFKNLNLDVVSLGQAFYMYREIQSIKDQKHKQEIDKGNNKLKSEQIDEEIIEKEQMCDNKLVVENHKGKKQRIIRQQKISYK